MVATRSLALAAAAAIAFTGGAQAHTKLVSSSPAANAAVNKQATIKLVFNEKVVPAFSGADVVMTGMPGMANHRPMKISGLKSAWSADGRTLMLTAGRAFPVGTYKVTWHAAGTDTHRRQGSYSFSVK